MAIYPDGCEHNPGTRTKALFILEEMEEAIRENRPSRFREYVISALRHIDDCPHYYGQLQECQYPEYLESPCAPSSDS